MFKTLRDFLPRVSRMTLHTKSVSSSSSSSSSSLHGRRVKLQGTVQRVVYRSPDNLFSILSVKPSDRDNLDVSVLGRGAIMGELLEGHPVELEGTLKTHKKYGMQLEVTENDAAVEFTSSATLQKYQDMEQNVESMRGYLKNGFIPQVGPATADLLVNAFGDETVKAMLSTKRLMTVNGIGRVKATTIAEHWKRDTEAGIRPTIMYLLSEFNLSFAQAKTLLKRYGVAAPELVKSNPYRLIDDIQGVGFLRADEIARRMGMPIDSDKRLQSSIVHWLNQSGAAQGHTCMSVDQVCEGVMSLLSISDNVITYTPTRENLVRSIEKLEKHGRVRIDHGDQVYISSMYAAETLLAASLRSIVVGDEYGEKEMMDVSLLIEKEEQKEEEECTATSATENDNNNDNNNDNDENNVTETIPDIVSNQHEMQADLSSLSEEQQRAVQLSCQEQLLVLTGGPGTGKTFTTRSILREWWSMGIKNIVLTSPTARAARHLGRVATEGKPDGVVQPFAMTIHKLLEYSRHKNCFLRTQDRPIEADAVVVDECSMLDTALAASLFSAMRPGTRVLIVGDSDQLPSVGAGNVLRDLVNSDTLPVVCLKQIYRQEEASGIVQSAHHMNRGDLPMASGSMVMVEAQDLRELGQTSSLSSSASASNQGLDCLWVEEADSKEGASLICGEIMDYIEQRGYSLASDVQVLSPMHKGNVGTIQLNRQLRARLNPTAHKRGRDLDVGDRCMQETNDYDLFVWNGECGTVVSVNPKGGVTVEFAEGDDDGKAARRVDFSRKQSYSLALSYACTIHKSQGQEFPVVVVPTYTEHYHMLSRELVYTALTRASQLVIFVGQKRAFSGALRHQSAFNRSTGLLRHLVPKERVSESTWRYDSSDNNGTMLNSQTFSVSEDVKGEMVDLWDRLDLEDMVVLDGSAQASIGGWEQDNDSTDVATGISVASNEAMSTKAELDVTAPAIEGKEEKEAKEDKGGANVVACSGGKYTFESSKGDGVVYTTQWNESLSMLSCDCPGFKFRRSCKHVKEVLSISSK